MMDLLIRPTPDAVLEEPDDLRVRRFENFNERRAIGFAHPVSSVSIWS